MPSCMENNTMQVCKWSLPIKRWGVFNAVLSKMHIYGYESEESRDYFLIGER